jgi:DNA primase
MAQTPDRPPSREELATALAANAAAKPFNLAVLIGTLGAGLAVGASVPLALMVALVIYAAAAARTMFDGDEAERVATSRRADRRAALQRGRVALDPAALAAPIGQRLREARATEARIRDAIARAELPFAEVADEVDGLLTLMEQSARRAQLLHEVLDESPPERIAQRLAELEGSGKSELIAALQQQLAVQRKVAAQLERFYDEMERVVVELDTVCGTLVSVSASTDTANQQRLAADVRTLRDELVTVSSGMSEAYEQQAGSPGSAQ